MLKQIFSLIVCVSFFLPVAATAESALYALDQFGELWRIDEVIREGGSWWPPCGTKVREALFSGAYSSFTDLVWVNGYFYASYENGKIVRFGLKAGDETRWGETGLPIQAMTADPQGQVYIGYDKYIAKLNLNTPLTVTDQRLISKNGNVPSNVEFPVYPLALGWKNGNLLVLSRSSYPSDPFNNDIPTWQFMVNPLTGVLVSCIPVNNDPSHFPDTCGAMGQGSYLSLAVRPFDNMQVTFRNVGDECSEIPYFYTERRYCQLDPTDPTQATYEPLKPELLNPDVNNKTCEERHNEWPAIVGLTYVPLQLGLALNLCAAGVICPTPTPTP